MLNLIINEYVKTFAKISTTIMLITIIVLAIGYNTLMYFQNQFNQIYVSRDSYSDDYNQMIENEKQVKGYGWETRVEQYQFMRDNQISQNGDWRSSAAYEIFDVKITAAGLSDESEKNAMLARFETMKTSILNNDWRSYLKEQEKGIKADQEMAQSEKDIQLWSIQYRLNNDLEPGSVQGDGTNWKNNVIYEVENNKRTYNEEIKKPFAERDQQQLKNVNDFVLIGTYRLEHDIEVATMPDQVAQLQNSTSEMNFWDVFQNSILLISIISLLIIIIAGSSVASEFSAGTIKFLLINPIKRWKILTAKYISILSVAVLMLVIYYIFNVILSGFFFGFGNIGAPYLSVSGGAVHAGSGFLFVAWKYVLGSLGLLTMATFAFAISSLVRNSALSIGLGVFLMLVGNSAVEILGSAFGIDWARYLIFANTNLNAISMKATPFLGQTVGFALIVIAVYMVVFLLTAWDGFVKRDIK